MTEISILTPRLFLREFETNDVAAIHNTAVKKGFVFYNLDNSFASAARFVKRAMELRKADIKTGLRHSFKLAVECRDRPNECIGYVAFDDIGTGISGTPDIGYLIDPVHQKKGFAKEAMRALMVYCYGTRNDLDTTWLTVHPDNVASQKVAQSLTFTQTGSKTIQTNRGTEPRLIFKTDRNRFMALKRAAA